MTRRITEVRVRNFRSIRGCRVALGPLTILVGPNGAGKSNFLAALGFVTDALTNGLGPALEQRGGIDAVRSRSVGHPTTFGMRLDLVLDAQTSATYAFEIATAPRHGFTLHKEVARVGGRLAPTTGYTVEDGHLSWFGEPLDAFPHTSAKRLVLQSLAALPRLAPLYEALTEMRFYDLDPRSVALPQQPDPGEALSSSGDNIASVIREMAHHDANRLQRLHDFVAKVNPDVVSIAPRNLGGLETIEFGQRAANGERPWSFPAEAMSEGTLRATAVLAALLQTDRNGAPPMLVAVEEPEAAIHPGAAAVLFDAMREASANLQVLATTHSPDFLDGVEVPADEIRVVQSVDGETIVGPADHASVEAMRGRLYSAGELLRSRQLEPDGEASAAAGNVDLFA